MEVLALSKEPLAMPEIAVCLQMPKAALFMILSSLDDIQKTPDEKFLPETLRLGQALRKMEIRDVAKPVMEELAVELQFTVHLASFIDD